MPITVPGVGYVGLGSMARASQLVFQKARGKSTSSGPRRRLGARRPTPKLRGRGPKSRSARGRARASLSRARQSKPARMVKGSAAAKRHMAKLRRMRKRR